MIHMGFTTPRTCGIAECVPSSPVWHYRHPLLALSYSIALYWTSLCLISHHLPTSQIRPFPFTSLFVCFFLPRTYHDLICHLAFHAPKLLIFFSASFPIGRAKDRRRLKSTCANTYSSFRFSPPMRFYPILSLRRRYTASTNPALHFVRQHNARVLPLPSALGLCL
jgi:hypothetical protein